MEHIEFSVETILEDLKDLEREMRRGLSGEGGNEFQQIMEEFGYANQFQDTRSRIHKLFERIHAHLAGFSRDELLLDTESLTHSDYENQIRKTLSEISQLNAVSERLQSLLTVAEMKLPGGAKAALRNSLARAMTWLSTVTSWIKRISAQLWNLLCGLLTPKEWKLGGKVGTGPLGLVDVTVEVTFGP